MAALQPARALPTFASMFARLAMSTTFRQASTSTISSTGRLPIIPALAITIPAAIQTIPSILGDIWEGILRAVPKSKTSHMKKRHRLLAGKSLKDVTSLTKCPACGSAKKMHVLCLECMGRIKEELKKGSKNEGTGEEHM